MQPKTYQLLTESVVNGVYVCEYKTYTEKEFKKMLKICKKEGKNNVRNCKPKRRIKSY